MKYVDGKFNHVDDKTIMLFGKTGNVLEDEQKHTDRQIQGSKCIIRSLLVPNLGSFACKLRASRVAAGMEFGLLGLYLDPVRVQGWW